MITTEFGKFLREKRKEHEKTQEYIAKLMGKKKMLISGMETGKNNPPQGKDLENMMCALGLDDNEKNEFRKKAAFARNTLPDEIINMKMSQNEAKYPVEKAKGSAAKYDQL